MRSKNTKKLSATTLIIQTIVSILLTVGIYKPVFADDPPLGMEPHPVPPPLTEVEKDPGGKTWGGSMGDTADPKKQEKKSAISPASMQFNVSTYLKAPGQEQKYLNSQNPIASLIIQIINFLVLTIGSICFVALVAGGFVLLVSHGNENALTKGKDIIKNALIGLVVVLCSYFITSFVQNLLYETAKK